jgi:hypothetical protein
MPVIISRRHRYVFQESWRALSQAWRAVRELYAGALTGANRRLRALARDR